MPSLVRRSAVIAAYLLSCFVLFSLAMASLAPVGLVSRAVHRRRALFHDGAHCADAALGSLGGHQTGRPLRDGKVGRGARAEQ